MNNILKRQILQSFKKLHRTRLNVFRNDIYALDFTRKQINLEYRSKKDVIEPEEIKKLLELSHAVEKELRTTVIQAEQISEGKYVAKITPDTLKLNNVPFKDCSST